MYTAIRIYWKLFIGYFWLIDYLKITDELIHHTKITVSVHFLQSEVQQLDFELTWWSISIVWRHCCRLATADQHFGLKISSAYHQLINKKKASLAAANIVISDDVMRKRAVVKHINLWPRQNRGALTHDDLWPWRWWMTWLGDWVLGQIFCCLQCGLTRSPSEGRGRVRRVSADTR